MGTSNKSFWEILVGILLAGVLFKLISEIGKNSKTEIISDEGIQALRDPDKKRKIDAAFEKAIQDHKETGVWKNPVVDFI